MEYISVYNQDMFIVKTLGDYARGDVEKKAYNLIKDRLVTETCCVPIKNKEFIKKYFSPQNDFVVYTAGLSIPYSVKSITRL